MPCVGKYSYVHLFGGEKACGRCGYLNRPGYACAECGAGKVAGSPEPHECKPLFGDPIIPPWNGKVFCSFTGKEVDRPR